MKDILATQRVDTKRVAVRSIAWLGLRVISAEAVKYD
jgi:hypothetical protein